MPRHLIHSLTGLMLALSLALPAYASDDAVPTIASQTPRASLEVSGRASVSVQPDTALIAFDVDTNARQAEDAVAQNAQKMEALIAALHTIMGDDDRLQSANFTLQPVFEKDDHLRPSGYRVSNRVSLETIQMGKIGQFIDQAAASGAGKISSLQFRSSHEADHRSEAAVQAVGQARLDAQKLAQAAGVRIVRVMQIRYAPQGVPGVFYEKAALAMSRTPIEIGDLTIEAEVTMVFEIE
jgi:uncharacterized protein YggE